MFVLVINFGWVYYNEMKCIVYLCVDKVIKLYGVCFFGSDGE